MGTLGDAERAQLLEGVEVDGQRAAFKSIVNGGGEGLNTWYRVVITEGRNREVRKLFEAVGLTVSRLIRIRYGTVVLPLGLKRGVWVDLDEADVRSIRRLANPQGDGQRNEARAEGGGGARRDERGPRGNNNSNSNNRQGNDRNRNQQGPRRNDEARVEGNANADGGAEPAAAGDDDIDDDFDPSRIPNPLQQTFDHRFVQGRRIGPNSGFGAGGSAPRPTGGPRATRSSPIRCRPRSATSAPTRSIARTAAAIAAAASAAGAAAAAVAVTAVGVAVAAVAAATVVAVAAAGAAADPTALSRLAPPLQSKALPK